MATDQTTTDRPAERRLAGRHAADNIVAKSGGSPEAALTERGSHNPQARLIRPEAVATAVACPIRLRSPDRAS